MKELICTVCGKAYIPGIDGEDNECFCSHRCISMKGGYIAKHKPLPIPVDVAREITPKVYAGQRVLTSQDIDMAHKRPEGTARRNFNKNRKHFIKGRDFFELIQPDEIRTLGLSRPQGGTPEKVLLFTASGYAMLAKSFNDELAWRVQRALVNRYFEDEQGLLQSLPPTAEAEVLKRNLLTARAAAEASGADVRRAEYEAILETEKQIGRPLSVLKREYAARAGITRARKLAAAN